MNREVLGCTGGLVGNSKTSSFSCTSHSENQNLRCPRCDSSNTKFCYYNNYNLTQPRHFCKTCRRYWTKGGALRNIPIGGGCRKNRISHMPTEVGKSSSAKTKMFRSETGRFHQEFSRNPILWDSCPNYHHLGFLRAPQKPNQADTYVGNSSSPKNDSTMICGLGAMTDMAARSIRFDSLNTSSTMGHSSLIWSNYELRSQPQSECLEGDEEFHQKQRLSSGNIFTDHPSIFLSNMPSSSSSSMLVSTTVAGGDLSRLNPAFSWSHLPTTNGSYL